MGSFSTVITPEGFATKAFVLNGILFDKRPATGSVYLSMNFTVSPHRTHECEWGCQFIGSFDEVERHEATCGLKVNNASIHTNIACISADIHTNMNACVLFDQCKHNLSLSLSLSLSLILSLSQREEQGQTKVEFTLTRADIRSVMNIKDLYLAIGELHLEMDNPRPDQLKQKIEVLEQRVQVSLLYPSSFFSSFALYLLQLNNLTPYTPTYCLLS